MKHTLKYIKDRCRINSETGCWEWSLSTQDGLPMCSKRVAGSTTATKTAWLLAGKDLPEGHVVWRSLCWNNLCCNPAHMTSGTRAQMRQACGKSGREKGDPVRAITNRQNAAKSVHTIQPEMVRQIEQRLRDGETHAAIYQDTGVHKCTVGKIGAGRHIFSEGRVAKAASIFAGALA